ASSNAFSQFDCLINDHSSDANSLLNPGAIFCPINAASIGIVPEPQNGSIKGSSALQFVNKTSAAASVSFKGASPCPIRQPLLCKLAPQVSKVSVATSFKIATSTRYKAPFSGNLPAIPCFHFSLSTIAFLTIAWQSDTLYSCDLWVFPLTGHSPSSVMYCSQGIAFTASKSSSKVSTFSSPTTSFTLSAVLNHKLQRGIALTGAWNRTLPFSTDGS